MGPISVSGVAPTVSLDTSIELENPVTQPHVQKTADPLQDLATLSPSARAHQLREQGESVAAIAAILDLSVFTIDNYLKIPAAKTPVETAPESISNAQPANSTQTPQTSGSNARTRALEPGTDSVASTYPNPQTAG